MEHHDRLSTSDCLEKADRLGFLDMEIAEADSLTPKGITVLQEYFTNHTNSPSILTEALRESSQDDAQVSFGKRCLKAAEQPFKKKLQTQSVCSNLGSSLEISPSAQDEISESRPEDKLLEAWYTEYTYKGQKFRECTLNNQAIRMRLSDKWICFIHLALALGQILEWIKVKLTTIRIGDQKEQKESTKAYHHARHRQGTLVDLPVALSYLKEFDIFKYEQLRHMITDDIEEPSIEETITRLVYFYKVFMRLISF